MRRRIDPALMVHDIGRLIFRPSNFLAARNRHVKYVKSSMVRTMRCDHLPTKSLNQTQKLLRIGVFCSSTLVVLPSQRATFSEIFTTFCTRDRRMFPPVNYFITQTLRVAILKFYMSAPSTRVATFEIATWFTLIKVFYSKNDTQRIKVVASDCLMI